VIDAVDCLRRLVRGESYGSMHSITDYLKMRTSITKESFAKLVSLYNLAIDHLTIQVQRPQLRVLLPFTLDSKLFPYFGL